MIDLIFKAAVDGFTDNDIQLLQLSCDVFEHLCSCNGSEAAIKK